MERVAFGVNDPDCLVERGEQAASVFAHLPDLRTGRGIHRQFLLRALAKHDHAGEPSRQVVMNVACDPAAFALHHALRL